MLLRLAAEAQLVNVVDDLAEVVAGLNLVFDLAEDLADLVLDGVGAGGFGGELLEVREEVIIDEVGEVIAGHRLVVVGGLVLDFGRGP